MKLRTAVRLPGRPWLIGLGAAAALFGLYLWAGYVLAPRLIRTQAMRWAAAHPGLSLQLGKIAVDPLRLSVSVRDISVQERGEPLASLARLRLGISPLTVFERAYHITRLDLGQPVVQIRLHGDGSNNLQALFSSSGKSAGPPPVVRIDDLRLDRGELIVTDLGHSPAARAILAPISFRLENFRTRGNSGGQFALQARGESGTSLAWRGRLSMSPLSSAGLISVANVRAALLAQFLPTSLPVSAHSGRMSLQTRYVLGHGTEGLILSLSGLGLSASRLDLEGGTAVHGALRIRRITASGGALQVGAGSLAGSLADLSVRGASLTGTAAARGQTVQFEQLTLKGASFESKPHRLAADSLELTGLRLPVSREQDGRLSLMRFLRPLGHAHARPAAPASPRAPSWHFRLGRLVVSDAEVPVRDLEVSPTAHLQIAPLSLTVNSLSDDLSREVPFRLQARIDRRGSVSLAGRIAPGSETGTVSVSMAHVPLPPLAPYLPPALSLGIHSGVLRVSARAVLAAGTLARLSGRASVYDFHLFDRKSGSALLGWQALGLRGIGYYRKRLQVRYVRLVAPTGLIVILPNRSWNLASLTPKRKGAPAPRAHGRPPKAAGAPFTASVHRLDVVDGSITFADESVEPHFRAPINALHGHITNLSTAHSSIADIALSGQVIDRFSPVTITGKVNLYGIGRNTDIRVAFDNIELPIFNPYSDAYAGYAIAKGKLSTRFHYRIVNRVLHADHRIIVDQLQWGSASASKRRVAWPIRLATALLKDREGVIHIDLPVTGSLDDPKFHIASIVWTMLGHLLEKVALAPFNLIGKLFAGAQKAQYVDFVPGSSTLPPGSAADLTALAHALAARPALQVEIPAGAAGPQDAVAIEDARIDTLVMAHDPYPHPAGIFSLTLSKRLGRFEAVYRARLGKHPAFPAHLPVPSKALAKVASKSVQTASEKKHEQEREQARAKIRWLREQLRPTVRPASAALAALGLARGVSIQHALLAHGSLGSKRLFLITSESGAAWHDRIRVKLRLK